MTTDDNHVICPNCVHQFIAIPVSAQKLMFDAGFEPPFTHPPQRTEPLTTIRQAIANDAWAISFQTFGQYRTALLKLIDATPLAALQEPTKEMIDAAERIDWADSDVRGNIVNMWQAMLAEAPPPQRTEQEPVQVSPLEFVEMVMEKEHLIGKPIFWAEWPNQEKNT